MTLPDRLIRTLDSDDPRIRQAAAMRLGTLDASGVMPALVSAMATEVLRHATAGEVDGALLLASLDDDHPEAASAARRLLHERR